MNTNDKNTGIRFSLYTGMDDSIITPFTPNIMEATLLCGYFFCIIAPKISAPPVEEFTLSESASEIPAAAPPTKADKSRIPIFSSLSVLVNIFCVILNL